MSSRHNITTVRPDDLNVTKIDGAVLLERKQVKRTDMVCDECGLICRRRVKSVPEYISTGKDGEEGEGGTSYQNGAAFMQVIPTPDKGINPPITECLNVAAENVTRVFLLIKKVKSPEEVPAQVYSLVQSLLFSSKHKEEYLKSLGEFELAVVHVMITCPDIVEQCKKSASCDEKATLIEEDVVVAMTKHSRIRFAFQDLAMVAREEEVKELVYSLITRHTRETHQDKIKEVCDSFIFEKVLPFKKYEYFSNLVIGAGIYCLACTYCGLSEANLCGIASELNILPATVESVRIRMGEDLSAETDE